MMIKQAEFQAGMKALGSENFSKSAEFFHAAAEGGNAGAQCELGELYREGVPLDEEKAVSFYRQAAEQGHPKAQRLLAEMYSDGCGGERDCHKAMKWNRMAATNGDVQAQFVLGYLYRDGHEYHGQEVPQDLMEAFKWFLMAAEQGDPEAQLSVGTMYQSGEGIEQDEKKAFLWPTFSASQGNSVAQLEIGRMSFMGLGWPVRDELSAYIWLSLALENGEEEAADLVRKLEETMDPREIVSAKRSLQNWKKKTWEEVSSHRESFESNIWGHSKP